MIDGVNTPRNIKQQLNLPNWYEPQTEVKKAGNGLKEKLNGYIIILTTINILNCCVIELAVAPPPLLLSLPSGVPSLGGS